MTIRVVLGEDNVFVREGVRALLDSYDDIEVVGVAADAPSLLEAATEHVPDVVVTDIKMPPSFQLEGIDCAHTIRETYPDTGVVVLSEHDDAEYALALLGEGHRGLAYLIKGRVAEGDELVRAIREVHAGGSSVDPTIAASLTGSRHADDEDRQVLDMMSKGMGYAEMAEALGTTQEAVDRRVTDLFKRMAAGGSASGADDLKRLHAAVVESAAEADTLRSYVPEQVAAGLALDASIANQRELEVTVLFSDIRGFSTLSERLAAREVAEVVGRHLQAMAEVVRLHGGTIDKFQGDAVMVVFGAPTPIDNHARMRRRVRGRDAVAPGRAQRGRVGRRRSGRPPRRDRPQYRRGDGWCRRRRGPAGVHGHRRRREHRRAPAVRSLGRRDRGRRQHGGGRGRHRRGVDRLPAREGPRGAGRGLPDRAVGMNRISDDGMRRLAVAVFALMIASVAVGVLLDRASGTYSDYVFAAILFTFPLVGMIVLRRRPRNTLGWLMLSMGFAFALPFQSYGNYAIAKGGSLPLGPEMLALSGPSWVWFIGISGFLLLLFPDGHLPTRRWRWFGWLCFAGLTLLFLGIVTFAGPMTDLQHPEIQNPFGIAAFGGAAYFFVVFAPLTVVGGAVAVVRRLRRSTDPVQREQLRWLAWAAGIIASIYVLAFVPQAVFGSQSDTWSNVLGSIAACSFVLIPVCIGIAILKYHLYDIDVVIRKTVVFAVLAGCIALLYVGLAAATGVVVGNRSKNVGVVAAAVAAAVVALAFQPLTRWARRLADRVVYGKRATPYEVLSQFGEQLGGAYAAEDVLVRIARVLSRRGRHRCRAGVANGG